ncbi:MAG: hypothetical protein ACXVCY_06565 [Pseudobdellovibrionaceae bacterium]
MKKTLFTILLSFAFVAEKNAYAATSAPQSAEQKDYFFIQNDHSQVMVDWLGQEKISLNVIMQSLGTYFKKAAENKDLLQDQILLTAGALQNWVMSMAKSINSNVNANTEVAFFPRSAAPYFRSTAEASMEKFKAQLKKQKANQKLSDDELTNLAIEKMPIGFDAQAGNVDDFMLNDPASSQVKVVAGDAVLVSVSGRVRVMVSLVLSLPNVVQNLNANLGGYAVLDRLTIPTSDTGHSPVYAILNFDFVANLKDLKMPEGSDIQIPLSHANLKAEFANEVKVISANKFSAQDHRLVRFMPVRTGGGFENSTLNEGLVPTERLPFLRAQNILPTGKIWKPLEKILGANGIFDLGFASFYGFEMDLINLQALSLDGRFEFYNRQSTFGPSEDNSSERGTCFTWKDKDHCISWRLRSGDFLDKYFLGLINRYLNSQKQIILAKTKQKYNELATILSGSYQAYKTRQAADGNYSKFSENMIKDLCEDGTLNSSDEQCTALLSKGDR